MTYVDQPDKKQKHPHYEHRTVKLDLKDNEFSSKEFHKIRKVSTHKKLLKSLGRIGMCLNNKPTSSIPPGDLNKNCLILINDYYKENYELDVGPLNDGYLIGLKHHRLGFKIFFLHNPRSDEFLNILPFFLKNTTESLTVFYSGRNTNGNHGIEFINGSVSKGSMSELIAKNCTGKPHVTFITDCIGGGSVFDIKHDTEQCESNMISMYVNKATAPDSKRSKRSHGIFTYYFSKIISDCPNITPNRLIERMEPSLKRFNEEFHVDISNAKLGETPIFPTK
ncbi:hypothetical protein M9Y10_046128 [Tritrichomonas musculus]|uniref:Uncharacterized protein n=1 Tax=Tritrichomonas musculus TaxID=1915356 RepID=A0ABR2GNG4_9EUKA